MRVIVVGASGNVGTAVLRRLGGEPGTRLVGVARRRPPKVEPYDRVESWHTIDVAEGGATEALTQAMRGADAVVNLAWGFQPSRDPAYLRAIGVAGSARVLDAAVAAQVPHLVHTSSVGVYAPKIDNVPVDETYPTTGVPSSVYSQHKVAAERHLDYYERAHPGAIKIARPRPGFILQADAGAALTRYGLPAYLPPQLLRWLPVLPVDQRLIIPVVHTADVGEAIARIVASQATGAFNLAATDPLDRDEIARLLGARTLDVPARVVRAVVAATWRAHLQPLDAGWIDLAFSVPLMDSGRARAELGWEPQVSPADALGTTIEAMARGRGIAGSVLRPHSVRDEARRLLRDGPRGRRRLS